jgi:hypothetical protein
MTKLKLGMTKEARMSKPEETSHFAICHPSFGIFSDFDIQIPVISQ